MLAISELTIRGFQSHVDSGFILAPGLTVITGPSDAGKTAVIRALRWLAFNEPQGDSFLHTLYNADGSIKTQAEQAEVVVELDSGVTITKTRRKGKTTYTHSLYPEPWEKAEVPQEIKEALGLEKQAYGDNFETCLNFAFQLDPPFLLSETGSAGAKVLGKLAGTEVVDKATGSVNKQMHRVRADLAQAEKTIGQLDVEMLEYLEVDTQYATLVSLEAVFENTEALVAKQKALVEQNNQHAALVDRMRSLHDTLAPLSCVPLLSSSLHSVSYYDDKRQAIDKLATDFWRHVETCRASRQTLRKLEGVTALQLRVTTLAETEAKRGQLYELKQNLSMGADIIDFYKGDIANADRVLQQKEAVALLCDNVLLANVLQTHAERHQVAVGAVNALRGRVTTLQAIDALQGKIEGVQRITETSNAYAYLFDRYDGSKSTVVACRDFLQAAEADIRVAQTELAKAWEEAGGICPMCGQATEKGETDCIH